MKLHRIELENLNSLYGTHEVDLGRDLRDAPLFLIVGPTGAGKSTLMDAVSLALFGQTPRLNRTRGDIDTDPSRQVMSHGTAQCRAVVDFSKLGNDGERELFRAIWSCNRAHGRPDGNIQKPHRSLERLDLESGEVAETLTSSNQPSVYDAFFEEALEGMTVDDFQRCILLPQGEFAAFLKADERERAAILERLTSTLLYKEIGQRAARKKRRVEERYRTLTRQLEEREPLPASEIEELREKLAGTLSRDGLLREEIEAIDARLQWLREREAIRRQLDEARLSQSESKDALAARADDFLRLDEDGRCRSAGEALKRLIRERSELDRLESSHRELAEEASQKKGQLEALEEAERAARLRREDARDALVAARPELERARSLEQSIAQARDELRGARDVLTARESELGEAQSSEAAAAMAHRETASELATLSGALSEFEGTERLSEVLSEVVAELRQLVSLNARRVEREQALEASRAELSALLEELAAVTARMEESAARRAPMRRSLEACELRLEGRLEGTTASETRAALQEAREDLLEAIRGAERAQALKSERADALDARAALRDAVRASDTRLEAIATREAEITEALEVSSAALEALALRQHLASLRGALEEDAPCPLCGSLEHDPEAALDVEVGDLDEGEEGLAERVAALEAEQDALRMERARMEGSAEGRARELRQIDARIEALSAELKALGARVSAAKLREQLRSLEDDIAQLESLQSERERLSQALAQARQADAADAAERTRLEAQRDARSPVLKREEAELEGLLEHIKERSGVGLDALYAAGLPKDEPIPLNRAVALAKRRVERHAELEGSHAAKLELARQHESVLEQTRLLLTKARERVDAARGEVERRARNLETLEASRSSLFDGDDPEDIEARLEAAVGEAEKAYETVRRRTETLRAELGTLAGRLDDKQARRDRQSEEVEGLEGELDALLEKLELEGIADLQSRLLEDGERERLHAERRQLDEQLSRSRAQLELLEEREAAIAARRPEGLEAEEEQPGALSALDAAMGSLRKELHDLIRTRALLEAELERHEREAAERARIEEKLEVVSRDYELWRELHALIGVRDGESFKQFAQILNLRELIDKANHRLTALEPRYELTVARDKDGLPRLGFSVCDHHHADAERPLTTLSGGETFLVSLSLALALADYRTVDMPIETLLLDEGFGTLDQETMTMAINALERLQAQGTQIGIITHVEALKDRVEARVEVRKTGQGRSEVTIAFGGDLAHASSAPGSLSVS